MGAKSSSTVNQTYDSNIVNKSDIDILNKNVNNFVADTVVSQAKKCSASITQLQEVDISNNEVLGDIVIGPISQNQSSAMTFDCVQLASFSNNIANGVMSSYDNALQSSFSTSALAQMTASAAAAAKGSFGSTGQTSSNSNVNSKYNFNSTTDMNQTLKNVVETSIQNNLNMDDVQTCIAQVQNSQKVGIVGNKGKSLTVGAITQTQAATIMAECVQESNNSNKITTDIATALGVTVVSEGATTTQTSMAASAEASAVNSGFFEGVAGVISSIGTAISAVFGGILSGYAASGISSLCICCCIIIIIFVAYKMMDGAEGSSEGEAEAEAEAEEGEEQTGGFLKLLSLYIKQKKKYGHL
jgi:hypothetical protein